MVVMFFGERKTILRQEGILKECFGNFLCTASGTHLLGVGVVGWGGGHREPGTTPAFGFVVRDYLLFVIFICFITVYIL